MIHVKHLRHHTYGDKYHCRPNNKRSKLSIRNTTQNCGKYDIRYTHDKYQANGNYSIDNYNCKYENYRGYHKRRTKKPSTAVYIGFKRTDLTQCISARELWNVLRELRKRDVYKRQLIMIFIIL